MTTGYRELFSTCRRGNRWRASGFDQQPGRFGVSKRQQQLTLHSPGLTVFGLGITRYNC